MAFMVPAVAMILIPFFAPIFVALKPPQRRALFLKAHAVMPNQIIASIDRALLVIALAQRLGKGGHTKARS